MCWGRFRWWDGTTWCGYLKRICRRGRCCRFRSWSRCCRLPCFIPEYEFTVIAVWMTSSCSPTAGLDSWICPKKTGCPVYTLTTCCRCSPIISGRNICPKAGFRDFWGCELVGSAWLCSLFRRRQRWVLRGGSRVVFIGRKCGGWCGRGVVLLGVSWRASVRWFCGWCWFWGRFILRGAVQ